MYRAPSPPQSWSTSVGRALLWQRRLPSARKHQQAATGATSVPSFPAVATSPPILGTLPPADDGAYASSERAAPTAGTAPPQYALWGPRDAAPVWPLPPRRGTPCAARTRRASPYEGEPSLARPRVRGCVQTVGARPRPWRPGDGGRAYGTVGGWCGATSRPRRGRGCEGVCFAGRPQSRLLCQAAPARSADGGRSDNAARRRPAEEKGGTTAHVQAPHTVGVRGAWSSLLVGGTTCDNNVDKPSRRASRCSQVGVPSPFFPPP